EHADLPVRKDAFSGYLELLETGSTGLLSGTTSRQTAPAPISLRTRPSRARTAKMPAESENESYSVELTRPLGTPAEGTSLQVTVINGDLTFVAEPLFIGHYRASRLTGAERVINKLVGDVMERSLDANE